MMIEYIGEEEDYSSVVINGTEFEIEDDEYKFVIPRSILNGIRIDELHPLYRIEICEKIQDDTIFLDTIPYTISRKLVNNMAIVEFEDSGRRKYWDGPIGFKLYMETKRDIVLERQKEVGDIQFETYEDDGYIP